MENSATIETMPDLPGAACNKNSCSCLSNDKRDLISPRCLHVGQKARIARIRAEGELGRRIRDMGLVPGALVEVVGRAPLRDPVALRLAGFTLSLRNNEADYIMAEPADDDKTSSH